MQLLNLPQELIVQILYELPPSDLLACQLTNKYLSTIIRESVVLQYNLALTMAKAEDNPCSSLSTSEKLKSLRSTEEAWAFLRPDFTTSVPVTRNQSGVYDLTGGVYLLSDMERTGLRFLKLPSREGEDPRWKDVNTGKMIVDIGLCVYEHDLMAVVTSTARQGHAGLPTTFDIEIDLLELSTEKPHPQAQKNPIYVMNSPWEKPAVGIEIVGKHLVLILCYNNANRPDDRIFIYEWQTSTLTTTFHAPYRSYSGLIFLNEELILLPNTGTNSLDIFRIPKKPTLDSLEPILLLQLPALTDGRILGGISCRAEPNPISPESYPAMKQRAKSRQHAGADAGNPDHLFPQKGFLMKTEDAICLFELRIHVLQLVMLAGGGLHMNFQFRHRFTFVVHRRALVDVVSNFCDNGTPTETLDSPLRPSSSEAMGQTHIGAEGPATATTRQAQSENVEGFPELIQAARWAQWGPPITRWFNSDSIATHWITTTAGQRCVRMPNNPREDGDRYFILDFNPENVKKMAKWLKTQPSSAVPEDGAREMFHDAENGGREDIGDFEQLSDVFVDEHMETEEQADEAFITPDDANASSLSTPALSSAQVIDAESENESDEWVDAESEVSSVAGEQEAPASEDPFDNVPPSGIWCATEPGQVGSAEAFAVPVLSALPYVACASMGKYEFDGVLLDEERVIGIRTDATGNIEQIDIHHFG
ncbi:hypothetical protein BDZ97DRAFT_1925109 [Flammula alnicola]|nr:hypothetical protein BDZ97DRAFT_1925109 [Flammula alnicola]